MSRPLRRIRTGRADGGVTTLIETGTEPANRRGERPDDQIIGFMLTPALAQIVCETLNAMDEIEVDTQA